MSAPIRFGIIGGGWRAEFFTRIVQQVPGRFELTGVTLRDPAKGEAFAKRWGTTQCPSIAALAETKPDFVILSAKVGVHLELLTECHRLGLAVLCETPAGPDVESMVGIWRLVEDGLKLHIAEQYMYQPLLAARLAVVGDGRIGPVSSARVATAHGYHGVSLMRKFLGIGFENATIHGREFRAPLVEGGHRDGPPKSGEIRESVELIGEFDFGAKLGVFNFIDMQYWSYARAHHVVIRGERGEIADLDVRFMRGLTPVHQQFRRVDRGQYGDLDGSWHEGILVGDEYASRNPFWRARLMDDEIAIAIAFEKMAAFVRGEGEGPYSFAEGAQDQYLSLLMIEAAKTGEVRKSVRQPWAG
jgi:predicted dehydrogenase